MLCANAQVGSWVTRKSLGNDMSAREEPGMASLNNKLYILGGYNSCGPKDFTEYDPATGVLRKLQPLGSSCANAIRGRSLFTVKGKIYSFNAYGTGVSVYDFAKNEWTHERHLPADLNPDAGFVVNDTIFVTSQMGNHFYSYNIVSKTFTKRGNYPGPSNNSGTIAFSVNGKGYWGGGTATNTNPFYEYNPTTDSWTPKAAMPYPYTYGSAIGLKGKGYAGLGEHPTQKSQLWYEYDPVANTWTRRQNVMDVPDVGTNTPYRITKAGIAAIGDDIFIFGGSFGTNPPKYSDNLFQYSTISHTWQTTDEELGGNRTEAAGVYLNGKIYAGGGHDSESLDDFWEYNPATNQWASKTPFPSTHAQRAAVELNGKGYFIGGYDRNIPYGSNGQNYTDALLEYDPATNQWTSKAPFPGGRRTRMVALVYNGKIYAGMGANTGNTSTKDFWEYDPATNAWRLLGNAPFEASDGHSLSYFVLGDAVYVLSYRGTSATVNMFKYSFSTNTWQIIPVSVPGYNTTATTNQAYVYNGKAYLVLQGNGYDEKITVFDPVANTWQYIINKPFSTNSKTIVSTPSGIYFGFGENGSNQTYGTYSSNAWHELKFDMGVSQQVGLFTPTVGSISNPPESCGSYMLPLNYAHTIYDLDGKLFSAVIAATSGGSGVCHEVNSIDTQQPYRTMVGKFDQAYSEHVMFLNKSILFKNRSSLANGTNLRLYYTTTELNKFVQAFNTKYNTSKTINDIKIMRYFGSTNDHDPLNNMNPQNFGVFTSLTGTFNNYGPDKYLELTSVASKEIMGELYAVLTMDATPPAPTVTTPVTYCQNATASALTATGANLKWYATATTSTSLSSAPVPATTSAGTVSYWVSQTVEGVEGPRAKIDVTVNPLPGQPSGAGTWASTITYGTNATFTVNSVVGATSYNWTVPAGFEIVAGQNTNAIIIKSTNGSATGAISVKAVNACGEGIAYSRIIASSKATPTVAFDDVTRTYSPSTFTLAATTNSSGTVSYQVLEELTATYPGDVALSGAGNSAVTVVKSGKVKVRATVATDANYLAGSDDMELTINKATATVTLSNLTQQFDNTPKAVTVTTNPANLTVQTTYNGSATVPTAVGTYAVVTQVVDVNYAGTANGTLTINTVTSSVDLEEAPVMKLYPNPSTGKSLLELGKGNKAVVTVTSASGKLVSQSTVKDRIEINLEALATGIYFVTVQVQDKVPVVLRLSKF
ncbi:hypothetical protein GCM10023183_02180 [Nibribacter koreensis]|uniref:Por secretion system C-terminal sorting domain-containing protein n=1 Tax=Nibribacter koreensis TaxID=1084519 RepID=A0ABP8F5Z0_9BACT